MSHHALFHNLLDSSNFKDKLVAYYAFENNANDIHSTKNGTITGSPTFTAGINGNGINFGNNANSNYVTIPDNNDFSFTDGVNDLPFSISLWARFDAFSSNNHNFISKRNPSTVGEWQLYYMVSSSLSGFPNNRLVWLQLNNGTTTAFKAVGSNSSLSTGVFYHIVAASGFKMYINGVLQNGNHLDTGYIKMSNTTADVSLGNFIHALLAINKHRGLIDEVAIWKDRELTGAEVIQLYNAGAGKFYNTY